MESLSAKDDVADEMHILIALTWLSRRGVIILLFRKKWERGRLLFMSLRYLNTSMSDNSCCNKLLEYIFKLGLLGLEYLVNMKPTNA